MLRRIDTNAVALRAINRDIHAAHINSIVCWVCTHKHTHVDHGIGGVFLWRFWWPLRSIFFGEKEMHADGASVKSSPFLASLPSATSGIHVIWNSSKFFAEFGLDHTNNPQSVFCIQTQFLALHRSHRTAYLNMYGQLLRCSIVYAMSRSVVKMTDILCSIRIQHGQWDLTR